MISPPPIWNAEKRARLAVFPLRLGGGDLAARLIFIDLHPNVMVSSTSAAYNLTVGNAACGHYAPTVMTIVALIFLPLVLLYQGWPFHVFRVRVRSRADTVGASERLSVVAPAPPATPPAAPPA